MRKINKTEIYDIIFTFLYFIVSLFILSMLLNSIDEKELTASDFDKITYISPVIRIVEIDNFKVWQNLIKGEWVNETV